MLDVKALLAKILRAVTDSGWIEATLSSSFTVYNSGVPVQYRKIGNVVYIQGVIKPRSAIAGSDSGVTIFTLPEGYRPNQSLQWLCQGSSANKWLLAVHATGNVTFARYGTTSYTQATTSVWLPFTASFAV